MLDENLRARITRLAEAFPIGDPALECIRTRARRATWRRRGSAAIVGLLLIVGVGLPLSGLIELNNQSTSGSVATPRHDVTIDGIRLTFPAGWQARTTRTTAAVPEPVIQAANYSLVVGDDEVASLTRQSIPSDGVVIVLFRLPSTFGPAPALTGPLSISHVNNVRMETVPATHPLALRDFSSQRRSFELWVEFGSRHAEDMISAEVNMILSTLVVSGR